MPTTFTRFPSPVGELILTASETALKGVFFPVRRNRSAPEAGWVEDDGRGPAGLVPRSAAGQSPIASWSVTWA